MVLLPTISNVDFREGPIPDMGKALLKGLERDQFDNHEKRSLYSTLISFNCDCTWEQMVAARINMEISAETISLVDETIPSTIRYLAHES